ncbi:hypothetical protein Cpap_3980 [Ruminiclostridium papyrosolvens DSM 2782]|uniref:Uncharacterized protein n=1 Tax=Ruminiclostridium papyrosolvens DSM 2782 TaxID=588581 RepID=F1T7U6_9FIRM|nr:hypothetical protein [Ruminiclostridium papyrosolvens]EGD49544.1 hypothetical protein Cpap_3980 [Ruminiclostridium papyrosolvens DSM 2782]WES33332.1 hypothetical protein P0092_16405 [Ruminiclostridium papyrosolvens DSM 2782]
MAKTKTTVLNHEKIGEIILPVDQNGKPIYNKESIGAILFAGISALNQKQIITDNDMEILDYKLKEARIDVIENLGTRISYDYKYNSLTGEPVDLSISFDSMNALLDINDTIDSLLCILCDITLSVIHPESNIKRAAGEDYKGSNWEKYAFSLLPEERATNEIIEGKLRKAALDYFAEHVNPKLSELLTEEYGEDWEDFLANNYAETVVSDLNEIADFEKGDYLPIDGYVEDLIYDHEWEEQLS